MTNVALEIAKNFAMGIPAIQRRRTAAGRTSAPPSLPALGRYVFGLLDAVSAETDVRGKSVLEIGPGDNIATGLAFLAVGARSYTALDRFPGDYGNDDARSWYRLVRSGWRGVWPGDLDADRFPHDPRVTTIGRAVEDAGDIGTFDIVCSFAVGEHVQSVPAFAALSLRATAPGGVAVHVVDFSGHQFADDEMHAFPEWVWRAMGSNRGLPNRVPFEAFHSAMGGDAMPRGTEATFVRHS